MNSAYKIKKAHFGKRTLAFLFDLICTFFLFIGIENLVMHPIVNGVFDYDALDHEFETKLVEHGIAHYDKDNKFVYNELPKEGYDWTSFNEDKRAVEVKDKLSMMNLFTLTMDFMISEFFVFCLIPLILKNGQTLGKKMMKLALVSTNEVKVKGWNVFARWALGIYVFETMITLFFVVFAVIPVPLILTLITSVVSKKGMALHDYIGGTIVVDLNNTLIIDTVEERRKRILEEKEAYEIHQKNKMISQKEIEKEHL